MGHKPLARALNKANPISTTTSDITVTPMTIFNGFPETLISCATATTLEGDLPTIIIPNNKAIAIRHGTSSSDTQLPNTLDFVVTAKKPPTTMTNVKIVMNFIFRSILDNISLNSGKKISSPAAKEIKLKATSLMSCPSNHTWYRVTKFVTYGPTTTPIIKYPVIIGNLIEGNALPKCQDAAEAIINATIAGMKSKEEDMTTR